MPNKTQGVYDLVNDVLQTMTRPYGEDVIDDVCFTIQENEPWRTRYNDLCANLRQWVVNNWIGMYVKQIVGMKTVRQVATTKCTIIGSYTKLEL